MIKEGKLIFLPGMAEQLKELGLLDKFFEKNKKDFIENVDYYYQYYTIKYKEIFDGQLVYNCGHIQKEMKDDLDNPIHKANPNSLCNWFNSDLIENQGAHLFNYLMGCFYNNSDNKVIVKESSFCHSSYNNIYGLSKPYLKYFKDAGSKTTFIGGPEISIPNLINIPPGEHMSLTSLAVINPIIQMHLENIADVRLLNQKEECDYNFMIQEKNKGVLLLKDGNKDRKSTKSIVVFGDLQLHEYLSGIVKVFVQNSESPSSQIRVTH